MVGEFPDLVLGDTPYVKEERHYMVNQIEWIDLAVVKMWHVGDVVTSITIKADNGKIYKLVGEMKMEIT